MSLWWTKWPLFTERQSTSQVVRKKRTKLWTVLIAKKEKANTIHLSRWMLRINRKNSLPFECTLPVPLYEAISCILADHRTTTFILYRWMLFFVKHDIFWGNGDSYRGHHYCLIYQKTQTLKWRWTHTNTQNIWKGQLWFSKELQFVWVADVFPYVQFACEKKRQEFSCIYLSTCYRLYNTILYIFSGPSETTLAEYRGEITKACSSWDHNKISHCIQGRIYICTSLWLVWIHHHSCYLSAPTPT